MLSRLIGKPTGNIIVKFTAFLPKLMIEIVIIVEYLISDSFSNLCRNGNKNRDSDKKNPY